MRTRRDFLNNYSTIVKPRFSSRKTRSFDSENLDSPRPKRAKKAKITPDLSIIPDFLDALPDDLLLCILTKLSSSSSSPSDFVNVLLTCKRLKEVAFNSMVLSKASSKIFAIKAENWCESAHKFIKLCSDSGNADASYTLGMIRFYCLQNRGSGASLMAKAAINSHAQALYSLAVIQFNGSGGTKTDKDLRAGVSLCARAAFLGHVDAIRELGHCLQDGYGVRQNVTEGRRFLIQANARELAAAGSSSSELTCVGDGDQKGYRETVSCKKRSMELECYLPLLSDFGCDVPGQEAHPVNGFLSGWWSGRVVGSGLRMCSYDGCGRPETRRCEFRRCSVCGSVAYCSRACQAMDWKVRHKVECGCVARWVEGGGDGGGGGETTEVVVVDDGES